MAKAPVSLMSIAIIEDEINVLTSAVYSVDILMQLNVVIAKARQQIGELRDSIVALQFARDSQSLKLTSHHLKLQSTLTIAVGRAIKHIGEQTRKRSESLRAQPVERFLKQA